MLGRLFAIAGIPLGLVGLALHFHVAVRYGLSIGHSVPGAVVFYLSFFTIQANMLVVLAWWASLAAAPPLLAHFRGARFRASILTAVSVASVVYFVALRHLWDPQGAAYAGAVILHYLIPVMFLAWWLVAGRDGSLRWSDLHWPLVFPVAYFAYVMVRAPIAGEVPYPFLDYASLGLAGLVRSAAAILALFFGFGAVYVLIDRSLGSPRTAGARA